MGSGKSASTGNMVAMMVMNQLQQQRQQEEFNRQMEAQKAETERATNVSAQATNANQKATALSTTRQDNAVRSQGMISKGGSANSTIKNKLGGALGSEEEKKEAWY